MYPLSLEKRSERKESISPVPKPIVCSLGSFNLEYDEKFFPHKYDEELFAVSSPVFSPTYSSESFDLDNYKPNDYFDLMRIYMLRLK